MTALDREARQIAQRLSLRAPQEKSLEILADVTARVEADLGGLKDADPAKVLALVQSTYPHVEDFERDFPSLTFALATGVGKTRLMGAFIAYLREKRISRHFLVLAPNLTIYDKLKKDFTPGTPKYVFKGLPLFATAPPVLVTGDDYEDGRGVRAEDGFAGGQASLGYEADTIVNIFNISKINADKDSRGVPRVRRLQEYIGESYFDYLAGLDDLVILMDEAHRYRASAGARAINELAPILGLELTATPKAAGTSGKEFRNIIYGYSLGEAMRDGFVKEPAVATREGWKKADYDRLSDGDRDRIKLDDGIVYHEKVKAELEVYARQEGVARVKPFVLVVARDTTHADDIAEIVRSDDFFGGRYRNKVITVHSNQKGEMKDDAVQRLLAIENPHEPTEIVIHVNKLGEGWDVTNLFTIVPLRASAADILTEQTIGRGLRLPYGRRTGEQFVDTLTIIAHDRFASIVEEAKKPGSLIKKTFEIGKNGDVSPTPERAIHVPSVFQTQMTGETAGFGEGEQAGFDGPTPIITAPDQQAIAKAVFQVTQSPASGLDVTDEAAHPSIVSAVQQTLATTPDLFGARDTPDTAAIESVIKTIAAHAPHGSISIPRIVVVPKGDPDFGFRDFEPTGLDTITYQPLDERLIIEEVRTGKRWARLDTTSAGREVRPEDYIIRALLNEDDIDYDENAELLQKLASAVVARLREYLPSEEKVEAVAYQYETKLADFLVKQMRRSENRWVSPTEYEVRVSKGTSTLKPLDVTAPEDAAPRHFSEKPANKAELLRTIFGGFKRALYPYQKFHSDAERQFAALLEDETSPTPKVEKWMKPARKQFQIEWGSGQAYEPDFVVETENEKWLVEVKRRDEIDDNEVQAKATAALSWCANASAHEIENGGKEWRYLLIPDDEITPASSLRQLRDTFGRSTQAEEELA